MHTRCSCPLSARADPASPVCSYGYDPLGLGQEPVQVEKYRANELLHARWAMLAAAGIIIPEGLQVRPAASLHSTLWRVPASLAPFHRVRQQPQNGT